MRIEKYWFGYVVVDRKGVALSQAFKTYEEAVAFKNTVSS
jgi:hypothetical protein